MRSGRCRESLRLTHASGEKRKCWKPFIPIHDVIALSFLLVLRPRAAQHLGHFNEMTTIATPSIREATVEDAAAICDIYNPYVLGTTITFEEVAVPDSEMRTRVVEYGAVLPWLVLEESGVVAAYAYATRWRVRPAYRFSAEATVYVGQAFHRRGYGRMIYGELMRQLRERGLHRVMGGVALPNAGSVGLHEALGFKKVAHFEQVGFKQGRWIDVGYWELAY